MPVAPSGGPLEFAADKRGRSRQVFDSILEGLSIGNVEVGRYPGVDAGSPPRRTEAHRIAMPEKRMHCTSLQVAVPVSSRKFELTR